MLFSNLSHDCITLVLWFKGCVALPIDFMKIWQHVISGKKNVTGKKFAAIATRHSWREIQESSLRSINFDRVIRMLSFFKRGKKKRISHWTERILRISWESWLFEIGKLPYAYSLKIETLLVSVLVIKTSKLSPSALLFQQWQGCILTFPQPF